MAVNKASLRRELIFRMKDLSPEEVERASRAACKAAQRAFDWSGMRTVLSYVPMKGSGEMDPGELTQLLGPKTVIDYVAPDRHAAAPTGGYDMIIVPMVGFTKDGYRLGRGGGWYDRLLAAHPESMSLGLAYAWSEIDFAPEKHDQRLTFVITDETAGNR